MFFIRILSCGESVELSMISEFPQNMIPLCESSFCTYPHNLLRDRFVTYHKKSIPASAVFPHPTSMNIYTKSPVEMILVKLSILAIKQL